ncbi:MAG: type II toxin-antitoxin system RelE/ParE family toxin [Treponemataceae bacterium]|mgnify:CR=1 FL=1
MEEKEPLTVVFFKNENDKQPCREFILSLDRDSKREIGISVFTVQQGFPMGLPLVRKIEADLWEIRIKLPAGICRLFFTICGSTIVLLHGFIKKSQKTPLNELNIARTRLHTFKELNK